MHRQSSGFPSNTTTTNQSHSPLSHLHSPSDLSSDPPNWRSGFGNGRFTVDSGGGSAPHARAAGNTQAICPLSLLGSSTLDHPSQDFNSPTAYHSLLSLHQNSAVQQAQQNPVLAPAPSSTTTTATTHRIPIPAAGYHPQDDPSALSNLVRQLSDGIGPSSLPTHFGGWSSHFDTHHFGSVPSSPVHGLENGFPVDSLLTHPSLDQQHPSHPFTTVSSAASSSRRFFGPSEAHHSPATFLAEPIQPYPPAHKTDDSQFNIQNSHLANLNNAIRNPASESSYPGFPSHPSPINNQSSAISALMGTQPSSGRAPPFLASPSSADGSAAGLENYPIRQAASSQATYRWKSNLNTLPPADNTAQPIRKLTKDAIYVSTPASQPNDRTGGEWATHPATSARSHWPLRESSIVSESSQSANYSPSSPYSSWSPLAPTEETAVCDYRAVPSFDTRDPFATHLWQLYGPQDEQELTTDTLENLVRALANFGFDLNQLRQQMHTHDLQDGGTPSQFGALPDISGPSTRLPEFAHPQNEAGEPAQGSSDKPPRTAMRSTPQPSRLSKIDENGEGPKLDSLLKSPLFTREPSLERGRKIDVGRRAACNLAGRWQECTNANRSPAVSDMDWKAHSRSRSRTHVDWRQGSRSRSRLQDFRPDLLASGPPPEGDSSQRFKPAMSTPGPFEPAPTNPYPGLGNQQTTGTSGTSIITNNGGYSDGLIDQLLGSYQAQQSEENGLQGLACGKHSEQAPFEPSGPLSSSSGLFPLSSTSPLGEFDMGPWHIPVKSSQHFQLGSIPGLTQDRADRANAHAEYGYIPRLVRKTSFDEILAQQHHPKRAAEACVPSPTRTDNLSSSTAESLARPNTASDPREGQFRMGQEAPVFDKASTSTESAGQPDYFDLLRATLSLNDTNLPEFKNHFQSSRLSSNSNSSDDLLFRGTDNTFQPSFEAGSSSIVDRMTPYDIMKHFDHFDSTPVAHNSRNQWLQGSVAPTAVQPSTVEPLKKPDVSRLVSSPSSTSSSSEASSRGGLALRINTANAQSKMSKELAAGEPPTKISFSGGRSNHASSIGEARKRTKQLPYSSADPATNGSSAASGSNGQNTTQCLNCQTTETPLWRRDSEGRPLCNACGLFVNLHGTPRPAALSTGIIKRRNRGKNRDKASVGIPAPVKPTYAPAKQIPGSRIHPQFAGHVADQRAPPRPGPGLYPPPTSSQ